MTKTNAIRILEPRKIKYEIRQYAVDKNDLSGLTVAKKINAEAESVFKTLVCNGGRTGYCVFCIPVTEELNLRKAAAASSNKKVEMIKLKDLFALTGYQRGGCSTIGMKKQFPSFIDESAQLFEVTSVSAGTRGMQILIPSAALQLVAGVLYSDLT